MKKKIAISLLSLLPLCLFSQAPDSTEFPYWVEMMQDRNVNFYEVQKAYETYISNKVETEVDGWKQYRRWEYLTSLKIDDEGNRPKPGHLLNEYNKIYNSSQKSGASAVDHWVEKGPFTIPSGAGGLGRINGIAFHPTNQDIIYAAASSGGVWKTIDGGSTWVNKTDTLPVWGASSLAIDYNNPDVIYMGTGDRDNAASYGLGVWKSTDGGDTWTDVNNGLGIKEIGMLAINPGDPSILLAGTNSGMYKTTNGGQSWYRTSNKGYFKDVKYHPTDTSIVYASVTGDFYKSTDGGENWTRITGIPSRVRGVIGVSPAVPNSVYFILCNSADFYGCYYSSDTGNTFVQRSNSPNLMSGSTQGSGTGGWAWYNLCVAVNPTNMDELFVGGINNWKSTDGGVSWSCITHGSGNGGRPRVHADQHYLGYSPVNGMLYVGNDGGVYHSSNSGSSFTEAINGLRIGQVYKIGQSALDPDLLINGYQDNGTSVLDGSWRKVNGADGMECIIDPTNDNQMYFSSQNGRLRASNDRGNSNQVISDDMQAVEDGEWVTPYILQEGNPKVMFAGYENVWRTKDARAANVIFEKISNNLGGFNNSGIRVLENSPADNDILYISIDGKLFFRSDNINDASPSYVNLTGKLPTSTFPKDVEAHPTDPKKVWIVQSNKVFESSNKGGAWTNISGSLPNVAINTIVYDTSSKGNLYVGTELGVYFKGHWMNDWISFNGGLPYAIDVSELEIYYDEDRSESLIKLGSYGRGMWSSPLYTQLIADFDSYEYNACVDQPVHFMDISQGYYTDFTWDFPGGNPSSSTQASPVVVYSSPGTYSAKLDIWNSLESDSESKSAFVNVSTSMNFVITPSVANVVKGKTIELRATGAVSYKWSPSTGLDKTTGPIVLASPDETIKYTVEGKNPYCTDTLGYAEITVTVLPNSVNEYSFTAGNVRMYPNPATDVVNLDFDLEEENVIDIRIHDLNGRIVQSDNVHLSGKSQHQLDVSSMKDGIYFVLVSKGREQVVFRVVVSH